MRYWSRFLVTPERSPQRVDSVDSVDSVDVPHHSIELPNLPERISSRVNTVNSANEQCERQFRRRPFMPGQHSPNLQDGLYHWGELDVGGVGGFSAVVTFREDG